jgi:hypothetical protein
MAVDTNIPAGKPGVAEFKSETFGGPTEVRYGDTAATTTTITLTASGANVDLPIYSVLDNNGGGLLADQAGVAADDRANYILAEPIFIADGDTMVVPVYRTGHFNMDALNWDASYTTDAQKKVAFEGSVSPGIFISKPEHNADAIW